MKTPLIIDNRGDLLVFRSKIDAESYLEAVDVQNGEYRGFDAEGRPLLFETEGGWVNVKINPASPADPADLQHVLQEFVFRATGRELESLEELLLFVDRYAISV